MVLLLFELGSLFSLSNSQNLTQPAYSERVHVFNPESNNYVICILLSNRIFCILNSYSKGCQGILKKIMFMEWFHLLFI